MNPKSSRSWLLAASGGAATVALVIASTAGIGAWLNGDRDFVSASGQPNVASDIVQAKANAVFESFNGTVAQRDASGVLQSWALNGGMDTCMQSEGFPEWDWSATRNVAPRTNALDTSVFFAAPLGHSYSNALIDMAPAILAEKAVRERELSNEEAVAVSRCVESTKATSDEAATQASIPVVVQHLRNKWWAMLTSLDERYGNVQEYDACFAREAKSLAVSATQGDSWKAGLANLVPSASEVPQSADEPFADGGPWSVFVTAEAQLEAVDWGCRSGVYESHLADVEAAIAEFASKNAADIEAAKAAWADVEKSAAELGFMGQSGSLER